jgi:hypothetical protein
LACAKVANDSQFGWGGSHIKCMDRRTFNTSLIGGAFAAALPLPCIAAAAKPATGPLYAWAVAIARAQNRASPALLAQQLHISQAAASELYASMIANGAIRAPLFGGMARAAQPLFKSSQLAGIEAKLGKSASTKLKDMKRAFDKVVEEDAPEVDASEDQAT